MGKYQEYRYFAVKICGKYQRFDEKSERIKCGVVDGSFFHDPDPEVNRDYVKNPDTPYVVVEKLQRDNECIRKIKEKAESLKEKEL